MFIYWLYNWFPLTAGRILGPAHLTVMKHVAEPFLESCFIHVGYGFDEAAMLVIATKGRHLATIVG